MPQRFVPLDIFRGATVALMFLVNLPGSFEHVYPALDHAEWHGLTFADLVFPWFLVCVGAAVPLAIDARRAKGMTSAALAPQIVWRSFLLFALGVFLGWILRPRGTLDEIRIAGVLQRIALVYGISALFYLWYGARVWRISLAALVLLGLTWLALTQMDVPGYGPANLAQGTNIFAWADQQFLPGRLFRKSWDPEGIGGTMPAIASALTGMAMLCALRQTKLPHPLLLVLVGGLLAGAGFSWSFSFPLNKNLWTSSYVLATSGLGFILWGLISQFVRTQEQAPRLILLLGQTALTAYIVHWMLLRLLITKIKDHWIGTHIFDAISPASPDPRLASLLLGLFYVALSLAPMPFLKRKGWLVKV